MNKSALKKFAVEARIELCNKVRIKALNYGISKDSIKNESIKSSDAVCVDGKILSSNEKKQRDSLIDRIEHYNTDNDYTRAYEQVIEEAAYTWFNRFAALRYMEIHNYLPTKIRVLSSIHEGSVDPDIMTEALNINLDIDRDYVYKLKLNNGNGSRDELFKYLIIKQCDSLSTLLPFIFDETRDYIELLFPDGLLHDGSFIKTMTDKSYIPESDWDNVEIIGWLYQYYIAEENDRVIKAKKRYKKEEIPFATQLFTPDWIVRYMVQNALGRYWVESHTEHRDLIKDWEFYLENPNPEPDFEEKLVPYLNKSMKVEEIKCFDPAMGSGHILVYMFDVLYEIYMKSGYMEKEIPKLIIENNLYGLDIDDRAYQLACFCVIMKAQQYNSRFLRQLERDVKETGKYINMNLASIQETNSFGKEEIEYISGEKSDENFDRVNRFIKQFKNSKIYGSLTEINEFDEDFLVERLEKIIINPVKHIELQNAKNKVDLVLENLIKQTRIMNRMYDVLVTNPPYIGNKYLNPKLNDLLNDKYSDVKSDVFSAFIKFGMAKVYNDGQIGFMTPFVWMFNKVYEPLRKSIICGTTISSLVQLEYSGFEGATVPICTFTLRNKNINVSGEYIKLSDFKGIENQPMRTIKAIEDSNVCYRHCTYSSVYSEIPGSLIVYWLSKDAIKLFQEKSIGDYMITREGLTTADNDRFLREWYEVKANRIGFSIENNEEAITLNYKWFLYQKGGPFRKWYGNINKIVNWENDGLEIKNNIDTVTGRVRSHNYNGEYAFREGITFPTISSGKFGARYSEKGFMFDAKGAMGFFNDKQMNLWILALLNSKVSQYYLYALAPTLDFKLNKIMAVPALYTFNSAVYSICEDSIEISKENWNFYETAFGFSCHPILSRREKNDWIYYSHNNFADFCNKQFKQLKSNEEELNRIFIDIYGLQDELTPEVEDKDITIRLADQEKDIKSFISYAVGCMLGRYSLDEEGLVYAGGEFDIDRYKKFKVDKDNVLPIVLDAYYEDDIVDRFVEFVTATFGSETLNENLEFIAETLGIKGNETPKDTIRRYFINNFFKNHVSIYKKRPIYWLFTSGKEKAFNALIYMHRYDNTTLARIRTDYLHPLQTRLDAKRESLEETIRMEEVVKLKKRAEKELKTLDKQIVELKEYDEVLHHMADMRIDIDLDDGVVVNYEKFKRLVAKI